MYIDFARKDLGAQKKVVCLLLLIFFTSSFSIFAGGLFTRGITRGVDETVERLGSGMIVVPSGYDEDVQSTLFEGKACTIDLDSTWTKELLSAEGVKAVSPQRYIATLSAECCAAGGIQMIAYDPDTDFVISRWFNDQEIAGPGLNEIIVGKSTGFSAGETVRFFGREFLVKGVLEETGMGYDTSAFISFDTAGAIAAEDGYSLIYPSVDGVEQISMIMVSVEEGYTEESVCAEINSLYGTKGISAYTTGSMVKTLAQKLSGLKSVFSFFDVILVLIESVAVFSVVSMNMLQRRSAIGRLISVGVTEDIMMRIIFEEYMLILAAAVTASVFSGIMLIYPFEGLLHSLIDMPFQLPGPADTLILIGETLLVNAAVLLIAVLITGNSFYKREPALIIREDVA
ncbi:MAG: ABC transporter permease [Clostridia bacterium]|nr:ABC transporter permease [Clostridia bacterium]